MKKILFILIAVAAAFVFQIAGFQTIANAAWGEDVLVTNYIPDYFSRHPSMDEAPNGDIYIAVEDEEHNGIRVYKSTDGGETWGWITAIYSDVASYRNPSLAYAAGIENWVFITYERQGLSENWRHVEIFRFDPANPSNSNYATIASNIGGMPPDRHIQPEICTESLYYNYYWVYVTYSVFKNPDYYVGYFSRSTDRGLTWSTPLSVIGNTTFSNRQTQPDIAYSLSGLYITFENLAWNGSSFIDQIWVIKSSDYGSTWDTPIQLTSSSYPCEHPRIATASNGTLMVAYTKNYGGGNIDVESHYSTDGGTTWYPLYLPWSEYDQEAEVELAVSTASNGRFHAVYWHNFDLWYSWAYATNPELGWSSPAIMVNETHAVQYGRPAVCPNPTLPVELEACVAWTELHFFTDIYFDQVSTCGNGVLEGGEDCDDGNTVNGDCCSATCMFESFGSPCGNQDTTACTDPDSCTGDGYCSPRNQPAGTQCTTDGNMCTDDECDGLGVCIHINNTDPCDDYLFCTGADTCSGGTCSVHSGDPCYPLLCDEITNTCGGHDFDGDGVPDSLDNCTYQYNPGQEDLDSDGIGDACDNCPNRYNPFQEDTYPPQTNGCGDACECEGNFNGWEDQDVDGSDAFIFKTDFGRSRILDPCTNADPCNGDFTCDYDVDGTDAFTFKSDFGRSVILNPCPYSVTIPWCFY
jgi:cysteine-rich repeat protein